VVTPGSMVQLNYRCRYVYPGTPRATAPKTSLPNGHVDADRARDTDSVQAVEDAVEKVDEKADETINGMTNGDVKEKISEVKDIVIEKAELAAEKVKQVGQKGKSKVGSKEKIIPNGYAHAPHWPLVSANKLFS
jgi:translocation protein SEC63